MPLGAGILRWVLACRTIEKQNKTAKFQLKRYQKISFNFPMHWKSASGYILLPFVYIIHQIFAITLHLQNLWTNKKIDKMLTNLQSTNLHLLPLIYRNFLNYQNVSFVNPSLTSLIAISRSARLLCHLENFPTTVGMTLTTSMKHWITE